MQSQHKESSGDSNEKKPLQPNSGAATKPLDDSMIEMKATDSSEEDEDEVDVDVDDAELKGADGDMDGNESNFFKLRREKRLAMNRASARARRKRNKVLLSTLSAQVSELTQKNRHLQEANEKLIDKVQQLEAALQQSQSVLGNLISQQDHLASAGLPGNSPLTGLHGGGGENHDLFRSLLNHPSSMGGSMLGTPLTPATPSMPTSNLRELLLKAQMSQLLQNPSASHLEAAAAAAEMRMQLQSQSEMGGGATGASPISRLLGRLSQHNVGPPQLPVLASTGGGAGTTTSASLQSTLLGQASGAGNALDGLDMLGRRGQGLKRKAEDDAERVIADALRRTGR